MLFHIRNYLIISVMIGFISPITADVKKTSTAFSGEAYDEKGRYLFKEQYNISFEGASARKVETSYVLPSGKNIANIHAEFTEEKYLPSMKFSRYTGHEYGTTLKGRELELFRKNGPKAKLSKKSIPVHDDMVVGPGFYFYILDHIPHLLNGQTIKMQFVQPKQFTSYGLQASGKANKKNPDLIHVTLKMDNILLRAFVPEMKLIINQKTHQILSYEGINSYLSDENSLQKVVIKYSNGGS